MNRFLAFFLCLFLSGLTLLAIPAKSGKFTVSQPDGSRITVELHGDEFAHWTVDGSGRIVERCADGWWRVSSRTAEDIREAGILARRTQSQMAAVAEPVLAAARVEGERHIPVILIQFSDKSFSMTDPIQVFSDLLNKEGYSRNGATGSVRDYYIDNSKGVYSPVFDIYGPYTSTESYALSNGEAYATKAARLLVAACKALDAEIDFSVYDYDNNGTIDMTLFYYAGYNQAEGGGVYNTDTIWPHQSYITRTDRFDGKRLSRYFCTSEFKNFTGGQLCAIGTTCHEFAHSLGLPDFYDTDYETNGRSGALYHYSLMASGSYNNEGRTPPWLNTVELEMLGWGTGPEELSLTGTLEIPSIENHIAYSFPATAQGETFLLECRGSEKWDASLPGHGLLVYHMDKASSHTVGSYTASSIWSTNKINVYGSHPCFYLIAAADTKNLYYQGVEANIPFPGGRSVTSYVPVDWDGYENDFSFEDIAYKDGKVSLTVHRKPSSLSEMGFHSIANPGGGTYKAGENFSFSLLSAPDDPPSGITWRYDGAVTGAKSTTLTAGTHLVEAVLSFPDGSTETITLELNVK